MDSINRTIDRRRPDSMQRPDGRLYLSRPGLIDPGDQGSCGHRRRDRHAAPANREVTRGGYPDQDR